VNPEILGADPAAAIAIKPGQRIAGALDQPTAENVARLGH
jgi:hypothetical protein